MVASGRKDGCPCRTLVTYTLEKRLSFGKGKRPFDNTTYFVFIILNG